MEGLDARAALEDEPELRSAGDLRRATHERWWFTTTSVLQLWLTAQERERRPTLLALSDFANTPGERPAEGRAARHDEGLRTHARTDGEPTAKDGRPGRTLRVLPATSNAGLPTMPLGAVRMLTEANPQLRTPAKRPSV